MRIEKNDIYANGNPEQNQAGRGVTGTFSGDVAVVANYIHENASAGLYLGDIGTKIDIVLSNNSFYNNALRQFGGFTNGQALVENNKITVDNPAIAGIGCEIGGKGTWQLSKNTFDYPVASQNRYRAFIGLNDDSTRSHLKSDWNLYTSRGPQRWRFADGVTLSFVDWQGAGFDKNSTDKW